MVVRLSFENSITGQKLELDVDSPNITSEFVASGVLPSGQYIVRRVSEPAPSLLNVPVTIQAPRLITPFSDLVLRRPATARPVLINADEFFANTDDVTYSIVSPSGIATVDAETGLITISLGREIRENIVVTCRNIEGSASGSFVVSISHITNTAPSVSSSIVTFEVSSPST